MSEYFFWMDSRYVHDIPQPAQRILAQYYVDKICGKIVYYSAEDWISAPNQTLLRKKIKKTSNINGFILFSIKQFNYGPAFDFHLLKEILEMGFELHFAREEFSLYSMDDLKKKFARLYLYIQSNKNIGFFNELLT